MHRLAALIYLIPLDILAVGEYIDFRKPNCEGAFGFDANSSTALSLIAFHISN